MKKSNQSGMLDMTVLIVMAFVVVGAGFAYWRISNNNDELSSINGQNDAEIIQALPENLDSLKTIEEIEQISGVTDGVTIIGFVLESENDKTVYKVTLSNGKKLVIDASTGEVLSDETTDISDEEKIPAGIEITLSPIQAYKLAATKSSSPIKSIEMEVEDKKVTYKIEYKDGSKIEIDATSGAVLKSEIKGESEDSSDENEEEHEDEDEDESEDEEDSEDSSDEDHEDEDEKEE